jgi:hypothetical protein
MTVFRRTTEGASQSASDHLVVSANRLARFAGRMLLWGCVLLLLVRGIASYFDTTSRVPTTTRGVTVTVTQPADTETSQAQGK